MVETLEEQSQIKPFRYWNNINNRKKEATKYKNRAELVKNCGACYNKCSKEELNEYYGVSINSFYKPNSYWDVKENRKFHALECFNRDAFHKKYSAGYLKCSKEELNEYFGKPLDLGERYIYKYEFNNKNIYIGLSSNPKNRNWSHLNNDKNQTSVYKYIKETKEKPIYNLLTINSINQEDVGELEDFIIEEYRSMGYNIINKVKGGSLGTNIKKLNKEDALIKSLKYKHRSDLNKYDSACYQSIIKYKWQDYCFAHMIPKKRKTWKKIQK